MARSSEVVPAPDDGAQRGAQSSSETAAIVGERREMPRAERPNSALARPARAIRTAPTAAMLAGRKWRGAARWIGLAIFALGAALIAYVFLEALRTFARLDPGYLQMQVNRIAGDGMAQATTAIFSVLGGELFRLLYLMLLGYLGSVMAGKGIQFFAASESVIDEAVVDGLDDY